VKKSQDAGIRHKFAYEMHENAPAWREAQLLPNEPFVFGGLLDSLASSQPFIELASVLPQRWVNAQTTPEQLRAALRLHLCFDDQNPLADGYERGLTGFWRLVNLLQWLPDMTFTSRNVVRSNIGQVPRPVDTLVTIATPDGPTPDATLDASVLAQWQELAELEVLSKQQIALLQRLPLPVPCRCPRWGMPFKMKQGPSSPRPIWPGQRYTAPIALYTISKLTLSSRKVGN